MELDVALSLPRDTATVSVVWVVRALVVDNLRRLGVTEDCIDDIRLALSEAVTNVVQHASTDDDYEVRLEVRDGECAISVRDRGRGLDFTSLGDAWPDPNSPRGRGVAIMRSVLDGVRFEAHAERGTVAHLVKRLDVEPGSPLDQLT